LTCPGEGVPKKSRVSRVLWLEKSDFALGQSPEAFALMETAPLHDRFIIFENCFAVKSWYQLSFGGTCRAPKSLYKSYGTKCQ
jgi:hypothetical protein